MDAGVRGAGGVSPGCQVKLASLEVKDIQGVGAGVVSGGERNQDWGCRLHGLQTYELEGNIQTKGSYGWRSNLRGVPPSLLPKQVLRRGMVVTMKDPNVSKCTASVPPTMP